MRKQSPRPRRGGTVTVAPAAARPATAPQTKPKAKAKTGPAKRR